MDGYMNIALEDTKEFVEGKMRRNYGDAFVRGNNGMFSFWFWLWFFSWGSYPLDDVSVTDSFVIFLVMYISADAAQ